MIHSLLAWHQTPIAPGRPSPAQIHLGRNLRDDLHWDVHQSKIDWGEVRRWKEKKNEKAKHYFDRGTRKLDKLTPNQNFFVWFKDEWKDGIVLKKT